MRVIGPVFSIGLVFCLCWGLGSDHVQSQQKQEASQAVAESKSENQQRTTEFPQYGYNNEVNILAEGWIPVTDQYGKRATRTLQDGVRKQPVSDVKFEIVWTSPTQYGGNYSIPELHDGKDVLETDYPSAPRFFERTIKCPYEKQLDVSIPDTPYSFYLLDGKVSSYFHDNKKDVIWRFNSKDIDPVFKRMKSISVSSKKIEFMAPGGDMVEFLTIDFSSRETSPTIRTWREFHGP